MKTVVIYYSTTEGQTSKIAEAIARELAYRECATHLVLSGEQEWSFDPRNYDGVILGAAVHVGRFAERFQQQVSKNAERLNGIPIAFYSVCLGILETDNLKTQEAERQIVRGFLEKVGLRPVLQAIFAGAIRYSKYGFLKKAVLHRIAKRAGVKTQTDRDYEFTDWNAVKKFADDFVAILEGAPDRVREFPTDYRGEPSGRPKGV